MAIGIGLVVAALAVGSSGATEIHFLPCDGMICVAVTLSDGKNHQMLLDTGNVDSWVTVKTAQGLGKTLEPVMNVDQPIPGIYRIGAETLLLGGVPLSARLLALDDAATGARPKNVEGGIAYTAFKDRVVEIDYRRHRLRIGGDALDPAQTPRGTINLITFGTHGPPVMTIDGLSINGRDFTAQFDTCFTGTMVVYDSAVERLGLRDLRGKSKFIPYTDGGVTMNQSAFGRLTFGGEVLAKSPARIYLPGDGKNPVHQPDGLFDATVGNDLFSDRVVTLDLKAMAVFVGRSAATKPFASIGAPLATGRIVKITDGAMRPAPH